MKMAGMGSVLKARIDACAVCLRIMTLFIFLFLGIPRANGQKFSLNETHLWILVDSTEIVQLEQIGNTNTSLTMTALIQHPDIIQLVPSTIDIPGSPEPNSTVQTTYDIQAYAKSPGHSDVTFNVTPAGYVNESTIYLRVTVMHSEIIRVVSYIVGWMYFVVWSISFYPQIYTNFRRKSVSGLSFDYLSLNLVGYITYTMFNSALYFSEDIQAEYFERYPRGLNPVHLNDLFFAMHADFATLIMIVQCFLYERANQRVSAVACTLHGVFAGIIIMSAILSFTGSIAWLDFFYYCSYVKLTITLIKYVPQAYMHYKRKSTVGWNIGNIFLDFLGGFLSVLQMVLNGYNYNDWVSFFGDFTKFGLGMFTLCFDLFFMLQHYVFYRESNNNNKIKHSFARVNTKDDGPNMTNCDEGKDPMLPY